MSISCQNGKIIHLESLRNWVGFVKAPVSYLRINLITLFVPYVMFYICMLWKSPCPGGHVLADIFAGNDPAVCVLVCMRTDTPSFSSSVYAHSYYWCLHQASWVSTDKRLGLVVTRDAEADTEDARARILPSTVVHQHSVNINITTPAHHFRKASSWSSRQ